MKRVLKGIFAAALSVGLCFSTVGCGNTVKDGSKIEKCIVKIQPEKKEVQEIEVELYVNYTGSTIEHFKYLANNGFYNGSKVSNATNYIEFGLLDSDGKTLDDKYDSIITNDYASKLKLGSSNRKRYTASNMIEGEFYKNGVQDKDGKGNPLTLDGALVLKRGLDDIYDENGKYVEDSYNTGKGVFAFTFGTTDYFSSADEFAILGKVVKTDATDDKKSSYDRLKDLMTDNASDVYYYTYHCTNKDHKCNDYGHYFKKDGDDMYKSADGKNWTLMDAADNDVKTFLEEFDKNGKYASVLPKTTMKITSVEFKKK